MSLPLDKRRSHARGFSLIELLVTVSIMVVITTVIVYNQHDYGQALLLQNTASNFALDIRQSQVYGTAVKEAQQGSGDFSLAYGIVGYPVQSQYALMNVWADGTHPVLVSTTTLPPGITLSACVIVSLNGDVNCSFLVNDFIIAFERPNSVALMGLNDKQLDYTVPNGIGLRIALSSAYGTRYVYIYATGQISVQ